MVECCVQENNSSQKQIVIYNINKSSSLKMAWIDFFHIYGPYFFHRHVNVIHDDAGSNKENLYGEINFWKSRRCLFVSFGELSLL